MAVNTPVFADGTLGKLQMTSAAGDCISLMKWRIFHPENKKDMSNYCVSPMSIVNVARVYAQVAGGWDTANPPHKAPYLFAYGATIIMYCGITATAGYLGTWKITSEEVGHSIAEGADYAFSCDLQGALTKTPV